MSEVNPWIETFTGRKFFFDPVMPGIVDILDIAHALSNLCRFTGHTKRFYSVAEHSVKVSRICDPKDALWGLLHDASEAYLGDMNRPLKHWTSAGSAYREMEIRVMEAVCEKFNLDSDEPESVSRADNVMLLGEKKSLLSELPWTDDVTRETWIAALNTPVPDFAIPEGWGPDLAESHFLLRYEQLSRA